MRLGVQYPIHAGGAMGSYSAASVNDADWHTLTATDFYDTATGDQLTAGMTFAFVGVITDNSSAFSHVKLRAASAANDGTSNTDGVIPLVSSLSVDAQALSSGKTITSIAYKKAAAADTLVVIAGFNRS